MPHLYEALTWTIDEPRRPREYVFHDGGELLANATRVQVRRPDEAAVPYANPHAQHDESHIVLCVAGPDQTPYFYIDRTNDPMRPQPAHVVAPNGGRIGAIAVSTGGVKGVFKLMSGQQGGRFALLDGYGNQTALLTGPGLRNPHEEGTITDPGGTQIAAFQTAHSSYGERRRSYTVRLFHPLPEPQRTLVLAALIGVELMTPAG
ncbi:hypothetical protein ETD83_40840 [Actinomadura soli]|uniref:Scramblase n=1 Tax=Actinomadura soli TaxID=2508997 RepID=A0A5C4IYI0_9ACTN|nr:hypothetical protein [Actinomadura soli]TMQ84425.1 hypothetical protein ETD83_40840 [Actinomadura soli]